MGGDSNEYSQKVIHMGITSPSPAKRLSRFPYNMLVIVIQLGNPGFHPLPGIPIREILRQFVHDRSTMLNECGCDVKERQPETGNRVALMNRLTATRLNRSNKL